MSISPVLGTILSEHKKISKHQKGALYHQYDLNFQKIIGYMLRLEGSVKDDNGEPTMSPMKSDAAVTFSVTKYVPLFSYWFYDFVYKVMSPTCMGVCNYTECVNCERIGCIAQNTRCHVSFTLQHYTIANLL